MKKLYFFSFLFLGGLLMMVAQQANVQVINDDSLVLPTANFTLNNSCLVVGDPILLANNSTNATNYLWQISNGNTYTDPIPSFTFDNYGYYCISLTATNACGSDTYSEVIFVNPDICSCYNNGAGYTNPGNTNIQSNTTWNTLHTIEGDVIIESGVTLTIDNTTLRFGPKGRIIVKRPGQLIVYGSTLTNLEYCGNMWQGIEVWGNNMLNSGETIQGSIKFEGDANKIENAHIGILLGARNMNYICDNTDWIGIFNAMLSGGIVINQSRLVDMKNNGIDIKYLSKKPPYEASANKLYHFNFDCNPKLLDENYNSITGSYPYGYGNTANPWAASANIQQRSDVGIWIDGQKDFSIRYCNFNNHRAGIESFDSKYNVYNSDFTQSYFGIKIRNTVSTIDNRHEISSCNFNMIPGEIGVKGSMIHIMGGRYDDIHDNFFGTSVTPQIYNGEGVFTSEASSFSIRENSFYMLKYGVRALNTGANGGYIGAGLSTTHSNWDGNKYFQCNKSIATSGNNQKLRLKCNMCNNTSVPDYTVNFESYQQLANQGAMPPSTAPYSYKSRFGAGNNFDGLIPNYKRIRSMTNSYNYYHHTSPPTTIPDVTGSPAIINLYSIGVSKSANSVSCLPYFEVNPVPLPISLSSRTFTLIDSLSGEISDLQIEYSSLEAILDNGLTYELLNDINSTMPKGLLKNKLIANSPLSDTVVTTLIVNYPLSHGNFKNVMELNMPVNKRVEPYLHERLKVIPSGIANQLKPLQAYNPNVITLASIQNEIDRIDLDRQLYLNELIMLLTDTLHVRKGDAITLLEKENNIASDQVLASTYLADGDYGLALSKLTEMNNNPEISEWLYLSNILLNLYQSGKTLYDLDSSEIDFIRQMAWKCPVVSGYSNAQSILLYLFNEEVPECLEVENKSIKIENNSQDIYFQDDTYLGDNYPDPFNGKTLIPCFVPENTEAKIIINDIFGRKIAEYGVKQGENNIEIDLSKWNSGIYYYGLVINGEIIEYKKMTLIN